MPLAPVKAQSQTHQPLPGPESRMEPAAAVVGSAQAASAVAGSPGRLGLTILGNKTGKHWAGCPQDREMPSRRHRCAAPQTVPTNSTKTDSCLRAGGGLVISAALRGYDARPSPPPTLRRKVLHTDGSAAKEGGH